MYKKAFVLHNPDKVLFELRVNWKVRLTETNRSLDNFLILVRVFGILTCAHTDVTILPILFFFPIRCAK
jgi:hypothetical protein